MNNLKFYAFLVFALFVASNINAHNNLGFERDEDNNAVDTAVEVVSYSDAFDSKQYNKWTKSTNFVKGIELMDNAILTTYDDSEDETVPYKNAIDFFQKELKQHAKNGYAKCNIAVCQQHIAGITLNKFLVDIFNGEVDVETSEVEDIMTKLEAIYQDKQKEKEKDVRDAIKTLDEGMTMLPVADKEMRCKVLLKKYDMLKDIDGDATELEQCLVDATKNYPCEDSYNKLILFYQENGNDEMLEKCFKEASNVIPESPIIKYHIATSEFNNKNYDKTLELCNQLLESNPDDHDYLKLRAATNAKTQNYKGAVDDYITLANNDQLEDPFTSLASIVILDEKNLPLVLDAVKEQERNKIANAVDINEEEDVVVENMTSADWFLVESKLHENLSHDYNEALECAQKAAKQNFEKHKKDGSPLNTESIKHVAMMYYKLGKVDKALVLLDIAAKKEGAANPNALIRKIDIESNCGMTDKAINDALVLKNLGNEGLESNYCSNLGWAYSAQKDWNNAIKAYDKWLKCDETSIFAKYMKGRALIHSGQTEEGREILQEIIDDSYYDNNEELKMFALFYLGRTSESKTILDQFAANTDEVLNMTNKEKLEAEKLPEVMSLYNLACWYSLHGDSEKALKYLRLNYETDNEYALLFDYAILDSDFDNVRDNPEFMNIINKYKTRWLKGEYKPVK